MRIRFTQRLVREGALQRVPGILSVACCLFVLGGTAVEVQESPTLNGRQFSNSGLRFAAAAKHSIQQRIRQCRLQAEYAGARQRWTAKEEAATGIR